MSKPYQEGPDSTFTHRKKEYQLDPILEKAAKLPIKHMPIEKLTWLFKYEKATDESRIATADISVPILVVFEPRYHPESYTVIDGLNRLTKASREGLQSIAIRVVPLSWLNAALIVPEDNSQGNAEE